MGCHCSESSPTCSGRCSPVPCPATPSHRTCHRAALSHLLEDERSVYYSIWHGQLLSFFLLFSALASKAASGGIAGKYARIFQKPSSIHMVCLAFWYKQEPHPAVCALQYAKGGNLSVWLPPFAGCSSFLGLFDSSFRDCANLLPGKMPHRYALGVPICRIKEPSRILRDGFRILKIRIDRCSLGRIATGLPTKWRLVLAACIRRQSGCHFDPSVPTSPAVRSSPFIPTPPPSATPLIQHRDTLSFEAAIHEMSGQVAERFGIVKRGLLKEGFWADINILDPGDLVQYDASREIDSDPPGFNCVIVNGKPALRNGQWVQSGNGQVLRIG